ncbi:MAG TPA: DUF192 domain-containing protein [Candidatus Nanoarchaeia archaeon]|nr:DUF192 domain-containing protein [Candidatus Nanoarchaeia archaeon]
MKKIYVISCVIFIIIFLTSCKQISNQVLIDNRKQLIKVNVEIADDNNERMIGLMFRENLDENSGMLFVFDDEVNQTFWMKNTMISLDMIFISKDMKIVDIKYATPCEEDPCRLYKSSKPAKYVLEVNGNFTIENKIKIDDKITLNQ